MEMETTTTTKATGATKSGHNASLQPPTKGPAQAPGPEGAGATPASTDNNAAPPLDPPKKPLSAKDHQRVQICAYLSKRITPDGKIERGALADAAREFDRKFDGVRCIWRKHRDAIVDPDTHALDFTRKKGQGRKAKLSAEEVQAALDAVPCRYRHSIRTLAAKTGIPTSTLHRHIKKMGAAAALQSSQNSTADDDAAAAAAAAGESPAETERQRQDQQRNAMELKLQNELKDYYEKEKTKMVEAAKWEARRQHDLQLEKMRGELQQQFKSEKELVMHQLRGEMDRHQSEVARLKEELENIGSVRTREEGDDSSC